MTPSSLISLLSVLTCVSVLSILVDFKRPLKTTLAVIGLGSLFIAGLQLWVSPTLDHHEKQLIFLFIDLMLIYGLFLSVSKIKGFRFAYTFIIALSVMAGINTLVIVLSTLTHHFLGSLFFGALVLVMIDGVLFHRYRALYQEVQAQKTSEWASFCITPLLSLCLLFLLAEGPLSMIFTLPTLEHELLAYALLFVSHIQVTLNLRKFLTLSTLKKEARLRETMLEGLRADLRAQIETGWAMKLLRHDLRHHLHSLILAHQGNEGEFESLVEKFKGKLEETILVPYCQHFSINAILSSYFEQARTKHIPVAHRIEVPETLSIEDIDLSMILANAIENAIHANQLLPESQRYLEVTIKHHPSKLTLLIENPVDHQIDFSDGLPLSHQFDHGLGTHSIRRLAKQAQGNAYFSAQKGRFTVIVQLPL